jgi:hypothetical protein
VCVPREETAEFEQKFAGRIRPHSEDNSLNHNFSHGVTKKICMS